MSLKESEMQAFSLFGAIGITAALFVPIFMFADDKGAQSGPVLKDMELIEATLAFKSEKAPKQPQKKFDNPDVAKPEGVSRDENKPVEEKKDKKDDAKKADDKDPFKNFRRTSEDENPGKPITEPGQFDGSEKGFAPENKGDPFFARLRADMNFQFPEIAKASSIPVGCIHLQPDGRIKAITFKPPIGQEGDDDLQTAAEAALKELQKIRNREPEAVPVNLLQITSKWLCFKFSVSSG
jgi:hypothetical protein